MKNIRKTRTHTGDWAKDKKFKHYWSLRMGHLKRALQGVGNLSNTTVYEYTDEEREKTLTLVREWKKEFVDYKWASKSNKQKKQENNKPLYDQYFKKG